MGGMASYDETKTYERERWKPANLLYYLYIVLYKSRLHYQRLYLFAFQHFGIIAYSWTNE